MATERCMACGKVWPVADLDAKPRPGHFTQEQLAAAADTGADFKQLEGPCCYGPGYVKGH